MLFPRVLLYYVSYYSGVLSEYTKILGVWKKVLRGSAAQVKAPVSNSKCEHWYVQFQHSVTQASVYLKMIVA